MTERYRLVFRGRYLPGIDPAEVAVNLAQLFSVTRERIRELLATTPATIKHDIDLDAGNRYQQALAEAGLVTHLEPLSADDPVPPGCDWDGVERRESSRRKQRDRREIRRSASIQPDRRHGRGRRSTD